jgi:hypothetical protein
MMKVDNTDMLIRGQEVGRGEVPAQSSSEHAEVAGGTAGHVDEILSEWAVE